MVVALKEEAASDHALVSLSIVDDTEFPNSVVSSLAGIALRVPNLTYARSGLSGYGSPSIRGIYSSVGAPTVGVMLNNTPLHVRPLDFSASIEPELFDLERVEVLRGPQGTTSGGSTLGGVIQLVARHPGLTDWSGWTSSSLVGSSATSFGWAAGGAVGGPIVPGLLGVRAAIQRRRSGGYVDRYDDETGELIEENIGDQVATVYRAAAKLKSGQLTLDLLTQGQDTRGGDLPIFQSGLRGFRQSFLVEQPGSDALRVADAAASVDLPSWKLVASAGLATRRFRRTTDYSSIFSEFVLGGADPSAVPPGGTASRIDTSEKRRSFELRALSRNEDRSLRWVAGLAHTVSKLRFRQRVVDPGLEEITRAKFGLPVESVFGAPLIEGKLSYLGKETSTETESAVFGNATLQLSRAFSITAGVRYSLSRLTVDVTSAGPYTGRSEPLPLDASQHSEPVTPRAGIRYQPTKSLMLYATVAQGFRSGGGNTPVPIEPCRGDLTDLGKNRAPVAYRPDTVTSYEVGGRIWRPKVQFNAALFRINWEGIQQAVQLPTCGFSYVDNLGAALSQGLEGEVTWQPLASTTIKGAVGLSDARFRRSIGDSSVGGGGNALLVQAGDRVPFTPAWSFSGSARHVVALSNSAAFFGTATLSYNGPYRRTTGPGTQGYNEDTFHGEDFALLEGAVGVIEGRWRAEMGVFNLLNQRPILFNSAALVPATGRPLRQSTLPPRSVELTLSYTF